jgi:hypothetical protein
MTEEFQNYNQQEFAPDIYTRLRDIEEKQRLLKDRTLLIGQNLVDERESTFEQLQDLKKKVLQLTEENSRMKDFLQRLADQTTTLARKEELMILQRQFDLFKP